MERASEELARVEVVDADDRPHTIGEAWKDRPALILWVRHFG